MISIPPIEKQVTIPVKPDLAFRRFTAEIASWWPMSNRPLGISRSGTIVFEEEEGGLIFHRKKDGERRVWGTVEHWNPPGQVRFSFHPGRDPSEAQIVDVGFKAIEGGTLVTLVHSGWDSLGSGGADLRDEFETGWEPVLGRFSDTRDQGGPDDAS